MKGPMPTTTLTSTDYLEQLYRGRVPRLKIYFLLVIMDVNVENQGVFYAEKVDIESREVGMSI